MDKVCKDNFADPLFFDEEPVNRPKAKQDDVNDLKDLEFEEGMFVSAEKYKAKEQAVWEKILNRAAASSKLNQDKKKRARQAKLFELGKEFVLDKLKLIDANTQRMAREDPEGAQDRAIERMWSESKKDKDMEKWMKVLREMGIVKSSESYAPGEEQSEEDKAGEAKADEPEAAAAEPVSFMSQLGGTSRRRTRGRGGRRRRGGDRRGHAGEAAARHALPVAQPLQVGPRRDRPDLLQQLRRPREARARSVREGLEAAAARARVPAAARVPKPRSLTGGVFGETDPLSIENSILAAKQADSALSYKEWKKGTYKGIERRRKIEGASKSAADASDKTRQQVFSQIDANNNEFVYRYAPELPSYIETLLIIFWYNRTLERQLGCNFFFLYIRAMIHKFISLLKMLIGYWDEDLINDTQLHIYKSKFHTPGKEADEDQVGDISMVGASHANFWMLFPVIPGAALTKFGERMNAAPAYVAATDEVGANTNLFGTSGMSLGDFLYELFFVWGTTRDRRAKFSRNRHLKKQAFKESAGPAAATGGDDDDDDEDEVLDDDLVVNLDEDEKSEEKKEAAALARARRARSRRWMRKRTRKT